MPASYPFIEKIVLFRHAHFGHCDIDIPNSNEQLECCLIGGNGTGKSTVLSHLYDSIQSQPVDGPCPFKVTRIRTEEGSFYRLQNHVRETATSSSWFRDTIEADMEWDSLPERNDITADDFTEIFQEHQCNGTEDSPYPTFSDSITTAFLSASKCEMDGVPAPSLRDFVAGQIRERDSEFSEYLTQKGNRSKTVEEAEKDFIDQSASGLHVLHSIWNSILADAALQFDLSKEGKVVSRTTGAEVPFESLNAGLTRYLTYIGLLFQRYFRKPRQTGFVFIDEPEAGLHPELQFHLVRIIRSLLNGHDVQLFIASQSPFIATQFPPQARVLLHCKSGHKLTGERGKAPEGAGPEEILRTDFGMKSIYPNEKGAKKVGRYTGQKPSFRNSRDQEEIADLLDEIMTNRRA